MTTRKPTHATHSHSHAQTVEAAELPTAAAPASVLATSPGPAAPTVAAAPTAAAAPTLVTAVANGSNHGTKVDAQAMYQSLISGLTLYYQPTDTFQVRGGTYTRDQLIAELDVFVAAAQATKASNTQWRSDIQAERVVAQRAGVLRTAIKGVVTARFGTTSPTILKFGYALPKPRTTSAQTKAVAAVKAKATREARGTKGKLQKSGIKGNVNVQLVVGQGNANGGGAQAPSPPSNAAAPGGADGASAAGAIPSPVAPVVATGAAQAPAAASPPPVTNGAHS